MLIKGSSQIDSSGKAASFGLISTQVKILLGSFDFQF